MKNKMFKRILALILCAITAFGASPAAFAAQLKSDYLHNEEGDYWYVDDKNLMDETMSRDYVDENLNLSMAMLDERVFFIFEGEGKKWLINMYKGPYGFIFLGSEVGIYNSEGNVKDYSDFKFVDDSGMIDVQLECYHDKDADGNPDEIFSLPYEKHRYANIIKRGKLTYYDNIGKELKTKVKFGFATEETAKAFAEAVKAEGFTEVYCENFLFDDSFYSEGTSVVIMWKSLKNNGIYKDLTVETNEILLAPNETKTIDVKSDGFTWLQPEITWESSDESVATVDQNGVVTAVDYGTVEIYIKGGNSTIDECTVTVEDNSFEYIFNKVKNKTNDFIRKSLIYSIVMAVKEISTILLYAYSY